MQRGEDFFGEAMSAAEIRNPSQSFGPHFEKLNARTKHQVIQLRDTFIANEKLKQKIGRQAA